MTCVPLIGMSIWVVALSAVPGNALAFSGAIEWDFRDSTTPLWQAGGDVAELRRTTEGLLIVPSGPAPTILFSGLSLTAQDVAYARLRVQAPMRIDEAYFGWRAIQQDQTVEQSSTKLSVPRSRYSGFPRTVWVRLSGVSKWAGRVETIGLIVVAGESSQALVIESIALVPAGLGALLGVAWVNSGLDLLSAWMISPGSMMSLGYVPRTDESFRYPAAARAEWTLHEAGALAVGVALILMAVARRLRSSAGARVLARIGIGISGTVLGIGVVLAISLEISVWRAEMRLFGGQDAARSRIVMGERDLVTIAEKVGQRVPVGSSVAVCLTGNRNDDEPTFWPLRHYLYPIPVEAEGPKTFPTGEARFSNEYFLELSNTVSTCATDQRELVEEDPLFRLYRSR